MFSSVKLPWFPLATKLTRSLFPEGFPVAPAELEGLLLSHPDISDACVIGIEKREEATEVPRAFVVLRQGDGANEAKEKELMGWVAERVAHYKKLRGGIKFVDQIPKSPSGKILRRLVRDEARKEERAQGPRL